MRSSFIAIILLLSLVTEGFAENRKLGFSGPLTGSGAPWGVDVKNVLQFANEKLANNKYSIIFEDDRCDLKSAVAISEKLSKIDKVREVFIVCGQAVLVAGPVYRRSNILVMAPLATPSRVSTLGVFRTSLSDGEASRKLAEYIRSKHEAITVLSEENEYPASFRDDFLKVAAQIGLKAENEDFEANLHDFRALFLRLKAKKVNTLFLNTQSEGVLLSAVKQLKELGMSPSLYGAYLPGSSTFLKMAGTLADKITFVDYPSTDELLTEEGKKLYAEYVERFGALQSWSFAFPAAFEAFRAVQAAIESGESTESYLRQVTFDGVFGKYTFDKNGDISGLDHVMREVRKGQTYLLGNATLTK